jgi:hypothetical protein
MPPRRLLRCAVLFDKRAQNFFGVMIDARDC